MKKCCQLMLISLLTILLANTSYASRVNKQSSDPLTRFQQQAPADTLFYVDGSLDWRTRSIDMGRLTSVSQMQSVVDELEKIAEEISLPEFDFFSILLNDFMAVRATGDKNFVAHYGLDKYMSSAFYMDGLMPVLQFGVERPEAILKAFDKAGQESFLPRSTAMWGEHQVHYWTLNTGPEVGFDLWFTLSLQDTIATITVIPENFSEARRLDILGLAPETRSLADTNAIATLRDEENFIDYMAGYFSVLELTRMLSGTESNKASMDLQQLTMNTTDSPFTPSCGQELTLMAEGMPRVTFGYDAVKKQGNSITMEGHAIIEVTNQDIAAQLTKLNGHLPSYVNSADDSLFSMALGLDVTSLTPVFNDLRARFMANDFACAELAELQMAATAMDPSALAIATAMGQGISGVGLAIYDLDIKSLMAGLFSVDGLVTIAAENPALLVGLVGLVPELGSVVIPSDGTTVPLNLPDLPPGVQPKVAVKGNQVVIFDGDEAASAARSLAFEKLNQDGLFAFTADYNKVAAIAQEAMPAIGDMTDMSINDCADLHSSLALLNDLNTDVAMTETFTNKGLRIDFETKFYGVPGKSQMWSPEGDYLVEELTEGCTWETFGYETLSGNGTGGYAISDEYNQCDLYVVEYDWQQSGVTLSFVERDALDRETCADEFEVGETSEYSCTLITQSDNSFDCMFDYGDGDRQVYRYTRDR
jgi:hypothetical protein